MANLDDFFAAKDKKKKSKKGFSKANTDVLAKNLEESARKEQKAEEKATTLSLATSEVTKIDNPLQEMGKDDEWKEYEEPKRDYTGLKIDNLKLEEEIDEEEEEEHEVNEDGEKVRKKADGGPWNKVTAASSNHSDSVQKDDSPEPAPPKPAPVVESSNVVKGSYVPPHMRGQSAAAASGPAAPNRSSMGGRRNKAAPDINSEVYFPSLTGANEEGSRRNDERSAWNQRDFEEVRSGGSRDHSNKGGDHIKLQLGNKFEALQQSDN